MFILSFCFSILTLIINYLYFRFHILSFHSFLLSLSLAVNFFCYWSFGLIPIWFLISSELFPHSKCIYNCLMFIFVYVGCLFQDVCIFISKKTFFRSYPENCFKAGFGLTGCRIRIQSVSIRNSGPVHSIYLLPILDGNSQHVCMKTNPICNYFWSIQMP